MKIPKIITKNLSRGQYHVFFLFLVVHFFLYMPKGVKKKRRHLVFQAQDRRYQRSETQWIRTDPQIRQVCPDSPPKQKSEHLLCIAICYTQMFPNQKIPHTIMQVIGELCPIPMFYPLICFYNDEMMIIPDCGNR